MLKISLSLIFSIAASLCAAESTDCPGPLDLETAIERLIDSSTTLKMAQLEIEVQNAQAWQDSLYPNPGLTIEVDSFGGKHECRGFSSSEVSYTISQLILLGGKREARMRLDAANTYAAQWDYAIAEQDAILDLMHTFIDTYLAQEKLAVARKQYEVAEQSSVCMSEKEKTGKVTALQKKKASVVAFATKIAVDKAESDFEAAKRRLAALWEDEEPDFECLAYPLYMLLEPPPFCELEGLLVYNPDIARAETAVDVALKATDFEIAQSVPDVEVSFGTGGLHNFSDNCFFVSFTMPIPLFDRNQGNISRASLQSWQAAYARENSQVLARKNFTTTYHAWVDAYKNAQAYIDLEQSLATDTLKSTEESYKEGKLELQDLLDAKKTWLDTKSQTLDAVADYHYKKAETLRLTAQLSRR